MKHIVGRWVLAYLRFFAQIRLRRMNPVIVGITGSAGKTSARNAVAAIAQDLGTVKVSVKANSESGIPMNILDMNPKNYSVSDWARFLLLAPLKALWSKETFDYYVVEMGIDSPLPPKNMEYLLTIIQPQIGVFLNVLPVHAAAFDQGVGILNPSDHRQSIIDAIAREKAKLILSLPQDGLAILNADDPSVMKTTAATQAAIITFGVSPTAGVRITSIERDIDATTFHFTYVHQIASLKLPYALPDHFGHTFAAALCLAVSRKRTLIEGCRQLQETFSLPPGRATLLRGIHDSILIDSSYNASTQPVVDSLTMLKTLPAKRRFALLGDMRELGSETQGEHERVLKAAFSVADTVYLVGPIMKQYGIPYAEQMDKSVHWFPSSRAAGQYLRNELQQGDVLLIKGSQNTLLMEVAVELLLRDSADKRLLCRRGSYWDRQRKKIK